MLGMADAVGVVAFATLHPPYHILRREGILSFGLGEEASSAFREVTGSRGSDVI